MLNQILRPEQTTTVLLETMAGKGSEVGRNFAEFREILDRVHLNEKMGVCWIPAMCGTQGTILRNIWIRYLMSLTGR